MIPLVDLLFVANAFLWDLVFIVYCLRTRKKYKLSEHPQGYMGERQGRLRVVLTALPK